jgi:hypothetical protein
MPASYQDLKNPRIQADFATRHREPLTDFIDHFHAERNHHGKATSLSSRRKGLASNSPEVEYTAASASADY